VSGSAVGGHRTRGDGRSPAEATARVAIVTGGADGIGWAISRHLLDDGWVVVIWDVNRNLGVQRRREHADAIVFEELDVRDRPAVERAVEAIHHDRGRLDLLVNNAGIQAHSPIESLRWEDWNRVIDVDLHGAFHCLQAAGRLMLDAGAGSIVNIASVAGMRGAPGRAPYCVSKAALIALTRVAAVEWAERGVRVNAVAPGYVDTPLYRSAVESGQIDGNEILQRIPTRRLGSADDIAAAVAFLASPAASYITGQTICVDGGFLVDYGVAASSNRWAGLHELET
jgi:3-oxoacyl-[acyl-carrier protein] reductase